MLDRLTLDQLRALIAVAETGSFSAAARKLGRVQSAISQTIQSLEDTLGVELFDRAAKTPKLNETGRVLLQDAYGLVHGAEALRASRAGSSRKRNTTSPLGAPLGAKVRSMNWATPSRSIATTVDERVP